MQKARPRPNPVEVVLEMLAARGDPSSRILNHEEPSTDDREGVVLSRETCGKAARPNQSSRGEHKWPRGGLTMLGDPRQTKLKRETKIKTETSALHHVVCLLSVFFLFLRFYLFT